MNTHNGDMMNRSCNGCTKCCEGHVSGEAKGIKFYKGLPCHFKASRGCTIYSERPQVCRDFICLWREQDSPLPEWMFPPEIGVMIIKREYGPQKYYLDIVESGKPLSAQVLSWIFFYHLRTGIPISYELDGGRNHIGPQEFISFIQGKSN